MYVLCFSKFFFKYVVNLHIYVVVFFWRYKYYSYLCISSLTIETGSQQMQKFCFLAAF